MAGSIFAKVRRQAKEKKKQEVSERRAEGMESGDAFVQREVKEVEPVSAEELNQLLGALNETAKEETVEVIKAEEPEEPKQEQKLFEAIGVYYDQTIKKYMKIVINYDPQSDYTKLISKDEMCDSQAVAVVRVGQLFSYKLAKRTEIL